MSKHDLFTRETAQKKLDRVELRLEVAEAIAEEIVRKSNAFGFVSTITIDSLLKKISSLLTNMTTEIKLDLYDLKTCLHHMHALPIRNEKGELE